MDHTNVEDVERATSRLKLDLMRVSLCGYLV